MARRGQKGQKRLRAPSKKKVSRKPTRKPVSRSPRRTSRNTPRATKPVRGTGSLGRGRQASKVPFIGDQQTSSDPDSPTFSDVGIFGYTPASTDRGFQGSGIGQEGIDPRRFLEGGSDFRETPRDVSLRERRQAGAPLKDPRSRTRGSLQDILRGIDEKSRGAIDSARDATERAAAEESVNREKEIATQQFLAEQQARALEKSQPPDITSGTGAEAFLPDLPPGMEFLQAPLQSIIDNMNASAAQQAESTQALLQGGTIDVNGQPVQVEGIQSTYDKVDTKIEDMKQGYLSIQGAVQGMIDQVQDNQEKQLARQEQTAQERLSWNETRQLRQIADSKTDAVESTIASLALRGRIQSDSGLQEVQGVRTEYEKLMSDVRTEFGIQRTDLAVKFSGLYVQSSNNYLLNSINNLKDTTSALERIAGQSLSSAQARSNAQTSVLQNHVNQQANIRKEYNGLIKDINFKIMDSIVKAKLEKQKESKLEYDRNWDTYKFDEQQSRLSEQFDLTKDVQEFAKADQKVKQIRTAIEQNAVIDVYRKDIQPLYNNMKSAYESGDNAFSDRALAKIYEKMIEPNSVVMPGEYTDIVKSAPLFNKLTGKFKQVLDGGQPWSETERTQLFELSTKFQEEYKKRSDEAMQQFYTDIDWFNSRLRNPENEITYGQVGLPSYSSSRDRLDMDQRMPENYKSPSDGNPFSVDSGERNDIVLFKIGGRKIKSQPILARALQSADNHFFRETGKHIIVASHFRAFDQQKELYEKSQRGEIGRAAPPGTSFHETGLAIDIVNWEEASPYLIRYGFGTGLPGDPGHFSIGELP